MHVHGATAFVTGANRGIGRRFVEQLVEGGAARVYAAARDPRSVTTPGVVPVRLDVLSAPDIAAAVELAGDVDLLINNAGLSLGGDLVRGDPDLARREMETNFWGTLAVTRGFADVLARNGGGAIVNVLSALSWFTWPGATSYSTSKAAEWSLTNATRAELSAQGTQVLGLHLGAADTDMMAGYEGPLLDPAHVVRAALAGLEAGASEVLADEWSRTVKSALAQGPEVLLRQVTGAA